MHYTALIIPRQGENAKQDADLENSCWRVGQKPGLLFAGRRPTVLSRSRPEGRQSHQDREARFLALDHSPTHTTPLGAPLPVGEETGVRAPQMLMLGYSPAHPAHGLYCFTISRISSAAW
jgi:hypothetical protein